MTDSDPLRRYVEAGLALTQLTRARAEALMKDLVKAGDLQREQAQDRMEELVDRSRKSTESLVALVRKELPQFLSALGFATKEDLDRLEERMRAGEGTAETPGASTAAAAKKAAGSSPGRAGAGKGTPPEKAKGGSAKKKATVGKAGGAAAGKASAASKKGAATKPASGPGKPAGKASAESKKAASTKPASGPGKPAGAGAPAAKASRHPGPGPGGPPDRS